MPPTDREAVAARWDSTDLAAIPDHELEEIPVTVAKEPAITFSVRLTHADVNRIRVAARSRGVGPTELARTWILEALTRDATARATPESEAQLK